MAATAMRDGGVIVLPTDTLYGFSAALDNRAAYERIISLKGSAPSRRFIALADTTDVVARYVAGWGSVARSALDAIWPAPLTAILPAGPACPPWVGDTIAFRVPANDFVRQVVAALGEPVVSTSVNRTGQPPMEDTDAIVKAFGEVVELIVARKGAAGTLASTLVDLTVAPARVVRQGDYAWPAAGKSSN